MARNGTGTYTLPAGNPVVTGTVISSTTHNNTMSDIATALTGSVAKNGETVMTGALDFNGLEIILDANGDTSITADTDDQIDVKINGSDDFRLVANIFRALSGSVIETNTINETTAASGVTIDSVLCKDGNVVLGNGNGIDFSATSDGTTMVSEVFDDYEEGTFTPVLSDTTSPVSKGQTYAANGQLGWYQKIGNTCHYRLRLAMAGLGTLSGTAHIHGLPFTSISNTNEISVANGMGTAISVTALASMAAQNPVATAYLVCYVLDAATGANFATCANVTASGVLIFDGKYRVNT